MPVQLSKEQRSEYLPLIKRELAKQLGCDVDDLPLTTSKEECRKFLELGQTQTLTTWLSQGKNGIVMLRSGRSTRPTVKWMVEYKASRIVTSAAAA